MAEKRNKSFKGKLRCHLSVCTAKASACWLSHMKQ